MKFVRFAAVPIVGTLGTKPHSPLNARPLLYWPACFQLALLLLTLSSSSLAGRLPHKVASKPDTSSVTEISAPEADVITAVKEVCEDRTIRGTYQYDKEQTLKGAAPARVSNAFGDPPASGRVFYKVADNVLAPRGFKESSDQGAVTVRYIVEPLSPIATSLRVDAVFIETAHRAVHASKGTVEAAEYGAVQQRLEALQTSRREEQDDKARLDQALQQAAARRAQRERLDREQATATTAATSLQELEQHVQSLRRQVEVRTKSATPLRTAPYHSATAIQSVPARAELVILIVTPYWYGVETQEGHRGWIPRSQLEPLP